MSDSVLQQAARCLRTGGLVAFPTETVYGLGADAQQAPAVKRIFEVKGRPAEHPLIVHIAAACELAEWSRDVPPVAHRLAAAFWPGPLTLIVKRAPHIVPEATGGLDTVGLRVPDHPIALELLRQCGGGVAAPSANRFGRVSPTSAAHVREDLGEDVDMIVDGGCCRVGLESTIVDVSEDEPRILRHGGISQETLEAVLGRPVAFAAHSKARAPGQLAAHYAPRAQVIVAFPHEVAERLEQLATRRKKVMLLTAHTPPALSEQVQVALKQLPSDPEGFGHSLYSALREADQLGCEIILACPPGASGLGTAILDRLQRAEVGSRRSVS